MKNWCSELAKIATTRLHLPADPSWKSLAETVNQSILDDAHSRTEAARTLYYSCGVLEARPCKQQARIKQKLIDVSCRDQQYFKVVSDFIAFRVSCEVAQIDKVVKSISDITSENGGSIWLKGSFRDKMYIDIVQYIYTYVPQIGYVIEFQVGHPFAAYTFKVDSAIRDNPNCGFVDLWKDNVYGIVKAFLLAQANHTVVGGMKYEALDAVHTLFNGNVPDELKKIIDRF